ncbi:MAG: GspE/PulE family protein [Actinomycetota bacterium]|nr:Flp pilus assembly complex ATPase component TadA [Actinomycetota bacterium]
MAQKTRGLSELILEEGLVSREKLDEAMEVSRKAGRSLGRILIDNGMVTESNLIALLAKQVGLDFVDLTETQVDPTAASLISESLAKRYKALPIGIDQDGKLIVAMSDPSNVYAIDDIRTITGKEIKAVVSTPTDILAAISRIQRLDSSVESLADSAESLVDEPADLSQTRDVAEEAPIVKLVNLIIQQAVNDRASDIHIEPQEKDLRVRYRIDGVLHEVLRPSKTIQSGVISRLKIMAEMDIAERRIPQDGRIGLNVQGKTIDLRVASLPTVYGEKLVLRILDKSSVLLKLDDLGFSEHNYTRFEKSFSKPYGMMLVTGPTGSGKSTTLYATLNILNQVDRNIITVEDPVEYRLSGINQVQTNNKAGLTFASALRSILRADPDIVLIGEIRDRETAQIAVEAALTGHLVLSTLHTNDAPSAITRLIEMGIEPFLVSSAVDCVVAQRLARRLCEKCKEAYTPTREALIENKFPLGDDEDPPLLYRPVGCPRCGKTGYRGRMAVHEVMLNSEEIERLTVERRASDEIKRSAMEQGMWDLRTDGMAKVRRGSTSLEEIQRVIA